MNPKMKIKGTVFRALLVAGCWAVLFTATTVQASAEQPAVRTIQTSERAAVDALEQKQTEIDAYMAGQGQAELEQLGFTVTNTGAVGDKVEVGITPYAEKHAEFLYEKFGRDLVNVVEGQQAQLLASVSVEGDAPADDALEQKQTEIDAYVTGQGQAELEQLGFTVTNTGAVGDKVEIGITPYAEKHAEFLYEKFGRDLVNVVEGQQSELFAATAASAPAVDAAAASSEKPTVNRTILWIAVVVVLSAAILMVSRKKLFGRK
ncbi:hypothetical protein [Paenibacillus mendelii]|uniref:Uncharacterized protein n=1 Tax=Paenibacillus mendelii TaxID=206163 RepID=A0ABV6J793_9BACL|nr:hypothetical protein [Paenibacillus mendelii]MCQ6560982.1 hypothetical protein [Paenibacillus mendelii]